MNTTEIIRQIEQESGMFETSQVTIFKGPRTNKAGDVVDVTVEVHDAGEGAEDSRYAISAYSEDGKEAHSNPAGTLDEAISIAHWSELD